MLAPDYLDRLPEPVLELFRQVEEDILTDMARRISKMGAVTETADWQRWRLEQMELTRSDITQRLGKLTGLTQQELRKLFQEAATQAIQADNDIYRAAGLSPGSPNDSPELLQLLNGGMQQTSGTFQNLTRTTANTEGKIVSLSGQKGYLSKSDIGYGTGDGFKGWNCRHDWFPFFEGLSETAYPREKLREYENQTVTYNGKTLSYYDATQQQRYIERQIRRWKREYRMMDAAGQDTTQASLKLAQWRAAEKDFCRQTGLDRDSASAARWKGSGEARPAGRRGRQSGQKLLPTSFFLPATPMKTYALI